MKKLGLLLCVLVTMGVNANEQDDSIQTAKRFCGVNQECIDNFAIELDSSYEAGLRDGNKGNHSKFIKARREKLSTFCIGAPVGDMCMAYRDSLLSNYIKGLSER